MDTTSYGATFPWKYGPGFVEMTRYYGYNDFYWLGYYNVDPTVGDYSIVVNWINGDDPMGLCCWWGGWPANWHWRAIRGYQFRIEIYYYIICTNSATGDDNEYLNWFALPYWVHDLVGIRGLIPPYM